MNRSDSGFGCFFPAIGGIFAVGGITGWVLNILTVAHTANLPINGMFILRCVGIIFPPLGAILGLFVR